MRGGGIVAPEPEPKPEEQAKLRPAKPKARKPREAKSSPRKSDPLDRACDKVLAVFARRRGEWLRRADLQGATGLAYEPLRKALVRLRESGQVHMDGKRAGARYLLADDDALAPDAGPPKASRNGGGSEPITTPDGDGARTDVERRVIEAVKSIQLTPNEIASSIGISLTQVAPILNGLCNRGALEWEDAGNKRLYGVPAA